MVDNKIVNDITEHADNEGSGYSYWYCGITDDFDQRLFIEHKVPRGEGKAWWIHKNAKSEQNARDTESYLLESGFDGGEGGGNNDTIYVYAYKKTSSTVENN